MEDCSDAVDLLRSATGEDLGRMPRRRLAPEGDADDEAVARPAVEVDDDGVGGVSRECLQVGRALRRNGVDLLGERAQPLDGVRRVRRPGDQNDAQA
ncbi:MAG TPA: hypothetical protein VKB13_00505 [Gaiellaceae bacterium]|nr:hypothetical protein [Gaiellaceae bacterium]